MTEILVTIHNAETGEITQRPATQDELTQMEKDKIEAEKRDAEIASEEAAKQQAFNDAVAQAVAAILATQTPATTAEPTVTE